MEPRVEQQSALTSMVSQVLDDINGLSYEGKEVDPGKADGLWYRIDIHTKPGSGLQLTIFLRRVGLQIFCNDCRLP